MAAKIPPKTAIKYANTFKKGTVIEVSSKDEGLSGSWYTATVIRTLTPSSSSPSSKLLVEYHNLFLDVAGSKPLREYVDYLLIRPIPPLDLASRRFQKMEDVDAYHNDGWWEGVVTDVIDCDCDLVKYSVFFRCSREEIVFSGSDLRIHREWIRDGVWVLYSDFLSHNKRKRDEKGQIMNGNIQDDKVAMNGKVTSKKGFLMNGMKNGSKKRSGSTSSNKSTKLGVRRNGHLKEPQNRASIHSGRQKLKK